MDWMYNQRQGNLPAHAYLQKRSLLGRANTQNIQDVEIERIGNTLVIRPAEAKPSPT
jgi:hypothetical protein